MTTLHVFPVEARQAVRRLGVPLGRTQTVTDVAHLGFRDSAALVREAHGDAAVGGDTPAIAQRDSIRPRLVIMVEGVAHEPVLLE